jgi:hypothetical protein
LSKSNPLDPLSSEHAISEDELGQRAWRALEASGGLWPPLDSIGCAPSTASDFWEAMGKFEKQDVCAVLRDALPSETRERVSQIWPWVARAIYKYQIGITMSGMLIEYSSDTRSIANSTLTHAIKLRESLILLNTVILRSPYEVGRHNWVEADALLTKINTSLGNKTYNSISFSPVVELAIALEKLTDVCINFSGSKISKRRRGITDPRLPFLVEDLRWLWKVLHNREPSTASTHRKDSKGPPFVRLVNGCIQLAGGSPTSRKKVAAALEYLP